MNAAFRAAGIAEAGDYQADASRDIELGVYRSRERNASRASIPYSHRRSQSITSRVGGGSLYNGHASNGQADPNKVETSEDNIGDEMQWGPLHPCFPHTNPHVPEASAAFDKTKVIRIRRDYLTTRELVYGFSRTYPEILEPFLSETQFREVVDFVNNTLWNALYPFSRRNLVDRFMSFVTANLYDDFGLTNTKRELAHLEGWIDQWNKVNGKKLNVKVISLRRTAYLNLDFQIPDPQISTDAIDQTDAQSLAPGQDARVPGRTQSVYSGTDAGGNELVVPPKPAKHGDGSQAPFSEKL